jgi:N-carbamoyl-L-amino-acid hydrolase
MIGSGVWSGEFDLAYGHSRVDKEGKSIRAELERINYLGDDTFTPDTVKAAFEVHIEQGPILEKEDLQVGVLSGVQGMNWYDLIIEGQPCHAGPSPMESRQDPFMGLTTMMQKLYDMVAEYSPWSRLTFGDINAEPGARNTVPERLIVAVDLRHPEQQSLDEMEQRFFNIVQESGEQFGLRSNIKEEWRSPAVKFDQGCVQSVRSAVDMLGYSNMDMVSGAGHDSVYVSKVAPTSMIFIPCEKGLSHNEAENAKFEDVEAGGNVLLHAMLQQSNH